MELIRRFKHAWKLASKGIDLESFNRCLTNMGCELYGKCKHETSKYRLIEFRVKVPKRGRSKGNNLGRNGL